MFVLWSAIAGVSLVLITIAFILILRFKGSLFTPLKVMLFFSVVSVCFKILGLLYGGEFFIRAYLSAALLAILLITSQINRVTIRNNILNYFLGIFFVSSCYEIMTVPKSMLSEEFTVLPIRNTLMAISAIINLFLILYLIKRARFIQRNFKGLVEREFPVLDFLIFLGGIQACVSSLYLLALKNLYIEILKLLNYIGMIIGTVTLLMLCLYLMKVSFFVSFSGLTGMVISIGDIVITSLGNVPKEIIPFFMDAPYNDITYISDRIVIKAWKTRITYGQEQKDFLFLATSRVYEYDAEKFLILLALSIEDRVKRDYLLKKKLLDTEYLMKQVKSQSPPKFLKEEFQKALYEYKEFF